MLAAAVAWRLGGTTASSWSPTASCRSWASVRVTSDGGAAEASAASSARRASESRRSCSALRRRGGTRPRVDCRPSATGEPLRACGRRVAWLRRSAVADGAVEPTSHGGSSSGTSDLSRVRTRLDEVPAAERAARLVRLQAVVRRRPSCMRRALDDGWSAGAAEQADEADEAFGGTVARMEVPPHARAGWVGRGHRFAAYPRCSADLECEGGTGMRAMTDVGLCAALLRQLCRYGARVATPSRSSDSPSAWTSWREPFRVLVLVGQRATVADGREHRRSGVHRAGWQSSRSRRNGRRCRAQIASRTLVEA